MAGLERKVRDGQTLKNNILRMRKRALQELLINGVDFQPQNLRTIEEPDKVGKILQVADNFNNYCANLMTFNLNSHGLIYDMREVFLNSIGSPIHVPLYFKGIDWLEKENSFPDFSKIVRDQQGLIYRSKDLTPETKGLSVEYFSGLEIPRGSRKNVELHEVAILRNSKENEEERSESFISIYIIYDQEGKTRREIILRTISTGGGAMRHSFLYGEDGLKIDEWKTGIDYAPGSLGRRTERERLLELGLLEDFQAPNQIDFERTWNNILEIVRNNYPADFKTGDLGDFPRLLAVPSGE